MTEHVPHGDDRRQELQQLVGEYVERLHCGEEIDPMEVLESHPDLAADVLRELDTYESLCPVVASIDADGELGTLGDYTLRRQVGRGGMGVVYEAWQGSMDRVVALKVLPPGVAADERAFSRFMREAKTAGKLDHQNIVSVHAAGFDGNTPYYAMEFVEGETLAQILAKIRDAEAETDTPFGKKDDTRYFSNLADAFAEVADGLQHAHSKGVTHRDVKPSNLILDGDGQLRILDFGLARLEGQESITLSGDFVGTPLYMSPEQAQRKKIPVDRRTDVYSLGATIYEAICGRPPFRGKDHADTLSQIIERDPLEPRKVNARVSSDLETIVLKCLRKDPADRYGTAEALAQDLRRLVRGDPIEARPQSVWEKVARRVWKHRGKAIAALVLVLLLATVGGLVLKIRRDERLRHEAEYGPTVLGALREMHTAQIYGRDAPGHELGLNPWGLGKLNPLISPRSTGKAGAAAIEAAIEDLSQAAKSLPERADAWWHRARAHLLLGDADAALADLDRALSIRPDLVPASFLKASILERRGDREEAEAVREAAESSAPVWGKLWLEAQRSSSRRDRPAAAKAFHEARESIGDGREPYVGWSLEVRLGRAFMLWRDDPVQALEELAVLRNEWPQALFVRLLQGLACRKVGGKSAKRAVELLEETHREATPYEDEMAYLIAEQYIGAGTYDEALRWVSRIQSKSMQEAVKAVVLFGFKRLEGAEEAAKRALELDPKNPLALESLVMFLQYRNRVAHARRYAERLVELDRDKALWRARFAWSLQAAGKTNEARRECDVAVDLRSEDAQAYRVAGHVYFLLGDYAKAWDQHEKAWSLERSLDVLETWAQNLNWAGDFNQALQKLEWAIKIDDDDPTIHTVRGQVLENLKRFDDAAQAYRKACQCFPPLASPWRRLGNLLTRQGKRVEASVAFLGASAIDAGPDEVPYFAEIQSWLRELAEDEREGAIRLIPVFEKKLRTVSHDRSRQRLLAALAEAQLAVGSPLDAVRTLERWIVSTNATADVFARLKELRAEEAAPDLASYASVDAALAAPEVLVREDARWRYFPGTREPSAGNEWTNLDFPDQGWEEGPGSFGYAKNVETVTRLDDMKGACTTLYLRRRFELPDPAAYRELQLEVRVDDGLVAWVNGKEVGRIRADAGASVPATAVATTRVGTWQPARLRIGREGFQAGDNVLALQCLNGDIESSDLLLSATLLGVAEPDEERERARLAAFREFATNQEDPRVHNRLAYLEARILQRAGKHAEAAEILGRLVERGDTRAEPVLRLAESFRANGDPAAAAERLRLGLEAHPGDRRLWTLWCAISLGDLERSPAALLGDLDGAEPPPPSDETSAETERANFRWLLERLRGGEAIRINSGGREFTSPEGVTWVGDRFATRGNQPRKFTLEIAATADDELYRTERWFPRQDWRPAGYRIPLVPGPYRVTLHFAEVYHKKEGLRTFDVRIEGKRVRKNYEPIAAGFATADRKRFDVAVDDGLLEIDFDWVNGDPKVSALEVERHD